MEITGAGYPYVAKVDEENRLLVLAITRSMEHESNQAHGDAYSLPFSVKPKAADDCIFYMKNTDDVDMTIEGVTYGATDPTADEQIYFKLGDSGTRDSATTATPTNLNSGSGKTATGEFEYGEDLGLGAGAATLDGGTEFERIVLAGVADKVSTSFNFSQDVILKKNGVLTIYIGSTFSGTYFLTLHFHYHN